MAYDPATIEPRWQAYWEAHRTFRTEEGGGKPKYYILDMFPYPSGQGLHVGHPEGYTATDILARYKRMRGFNVLHPMGWDAFGLPAENYAVKTGTHPAETTRRNIATFKRQLRRFGFSYDWDREIATTHPQYYRWTQWIFTMFYKQGLAYEAEVPVNWCPALGTVLANEEVVDGKSEIGGHPVIRRPMKQWMLRITAYAERLLADLDGLDWPESIKDLQRNWIGRSDGAEVAFPVSGQDRVLRIFTTRPDTMFGATYMVVSPEHPWVAELATPAQREVVAAYCEQAARRSDRDRQTAKDKTGVFTGSFCRNPATGREIPIWVADYVMMGYGTGAIMAVPGQDERDWEFAEVFDLPIVRTVQPPADFDGKAYLGDGPAINSGFLDGLEVAAAKERMIAWLAEQGLGERKVNYKLRDWLFSRQRYWGEPFPLLKFADGTVRVLEPDELPLTLPEVEHYKPAGTGEGPLAAISDWIETVDPRTGRPARRESNTMPQWAGSCWYYLRFVDPRNEQAAWAPQKERYWLPVDLYLGGTEHAVLHLLYARFWHKVLFDLGLVSTPEPFQCLRNQGMILGENGEKMSKSRGNVVNPDDVIAAHGADALRMFLMFLGPLERDKPWNTRGIEGIHRFLDRVWRLFCDESDELAPQVDDNQPTEQAWRCLHQCIDAVTDRTEKLLFNTAISQLMVFVNEMNQMPARPRAVLEPFVLLLAPYAPHLAEELWAKLGHRDSLAYEPWPLADARYLTQAAVTYVVQINGKVRDRIEVAAAADEAAVRQAALASEKVQKWLDGKTITKCVFVPGKLLGLVVD
ncbi:MAG: leucine--tRNA ligase [Candidatus Krumholzibacteria bacterium]|jgi:leucyl-tRNA synthetase|nr:leucine--tRNA ligase [Candidatus Krumholzibacteria bacterium]